MDFGDRPPRIVRWNAHLEPWVGRVVEYDAAEDASRLRAATEVTSNLPDEVARAIIDQTADRPFRVSYGGRRSVQGGRGRSPISLVYADQRGSGTVWDSQTDGLRRHLPMLLGNHDRVWVRMPGTTRYAGIRTRDTYDYYVRRRRTGRGRRRRTVPGFTPEVAVLRQAEEYWRNAPRRRAIRRPVARRPVAGRGNSER